MTHILHASTDRHDMWSGRKRYIRIVVHDTIEEFYKGASRHSPHQDWGPPVAGCFHPAYVREFYDKKTKVRIEKKTSYAGTMRLCKDHMSAEYVVHECVHAAAAIYRQDCHTSIVLGKDSNYREENLAYIVGDLAGQVSTALWTAKLWTGEDA